MRKLIYLLLLALAFACGVFAQTTGTVTGTVTDLGSQAWNSGTYSITFIPPFGYTGTMYQGSLALTAANLATQNGVLNSSGAFSATLTTTSNMTPVGAQWKIQVCPQATWPCSTFVFGVNPGSQSISSLLTPPAIAISLTNPPGPFTAAYADGEIVAAPIGGVYYNLTAGAQHICTVVSGQTCTTWSTSSGGGSFSSLTGGTSTGQAFVVGNGSSMGPSGTGTITATNGPSTKSNFLPVGVINTTASSYATPIGATIPDATFTSGQATIDCTFSNDCNFVAGTDNGKICFGTNFTTDISILNPTSVVLAEGTLTVTDAQHATCSGGNSTATTTHNGTFVWGFAGHTQLASAFTDCIAQNGCVLMLPPGPVLVEAGFGNTDCVKCLRAVGYGGIQVTGWGQTVSMIIPTPNFNATTCTGGPSGDLNGCMFSGTSQQLSNFGILGVGQAALGSGFNGKVGIITQGGGGTGGYANSYLNSLLLASWGATTTGFVGLKGEAQSDSTWHDVHVDGFGNNNCLIADTVVPNSLYTLEGSYCAVSATDSLIVTAGNVASHGGVYGYLSGNGRAVNCNGAVVCSFYGDVAPYNTGTSGTGFLAQGGATVFLNGVIITNGATTAYGAGTFGSGSELHIRDTIITVNSTSGTALINQAGNTTYLEGGNHLLGGGGGGTAINRSGGSIFFAGVDATYTGTLTGITPTLASTGTGTTPCTPTATTGSTNEKGTFTCTLTTGSGTSGTFTLTFAGTTFGGPTGSAPRCSLVLKNGTSSWTAPVTIIEGTTSTTSYVWNFTNGGALPTSGTVLGTWVCSPS